MEPAEVLSAALAVMTESKVPEHLQPVALAKLIDLMAGSTQPMAGAREQVPRLAEVHTGVGGGLGERGAAIARELEIDPVLLERLLDEHDGVLQFAGDLEKLGGSKQAKVEKLSVILSAARQSGGYDEDGRTPDTAIRAEVERHGLYDVANYSKHLKYLRSRSNVNGSGRSMTYKLKYEGRVAAREIAKTLLRD